MTEEKKKAQIGRLAIRDEGTFINAYWAPEQHTMEGAILVASVRRVLVAVERVKFEAWRIFVQHALDPMIADLAGGKAVWGEPERAPEHERSGHS